MLINGISNGEILTGIQSLYDQVVRLLQVPESVQLILFCFGLSSY